MNLIEIMSLTIDELAKLRMPIVFKGAMVLKQVLYSNNIWCPSRDTHDIDMRWINDASEKNIEDAINKALLNLNISGMHAECTREFGENKTAGYTVFLNNKKIFKFDVECGRGNDNVAMYSAEYMSNHGVRFIGVSVQKMCADKISAISTVKVFRRSKDVFDLYMLSQLQGITISSIANVISYDENKTGIKRIGTFSDFNSRIDELRFSYEKLSGIESKPDFENVYSRVHSFCIPFMTDAYKEIDGVWVPNPGIWVSRK